ncbi:tetratricopeptide repeat protein [Alcaligenes endophyticus]|uniref:Tetratricopeptide repeat protein n=1 Tax=Alcaligenes endophyticus TaxID=1929088 RepID=A0ABT8EHD4_9BURK|nr:tetratricopeptide repeat protein [Alcaligenes endophyticus]MCX5592054.1 tetratricopeptide repeat protein [Alcaligenes endophyticus]MDN4120701.1 tetratricopeptide repeat protein [Alcaligenes endophyticus]
MKGQTRKWMMVLALTALVTGCASKTTDSAYELMREQQEQQAYVQGKEIEHWEKRKPSNRQMALQMLEQTVQQGKYFAALAYADAMQAQFGAEPALLILRAEALRQTGQLPEAGSLYQTLVSTSESARAWQGLGLVSGAQQNYSKAAEYFSQAARLEPADASVQSDLAYASLRAGELAQARLALGKAAELEPENPRILSNMALFLLVSGEPNRATFVMQQAGLSEQAQLAVVNMAADVLEELQAIHAHRERSRSSLLPAIKGRASGISTSAPLTVVSQPAVDQALSGHRPLLESMVSGTY